MIKNFIYKAFLFLDRKNIIRINDELYLKMMYWIRLNKKLNLDNPKGFNEKLQWLKLYDRQEKYTKMVDKYEAKKYVLTKGTDLKYGARPLRRAIQRYVEDELSDMILKSELTNGKKVLVEYDKEQDKLVFNIQ